MTNAELAIAEYKARLDGDEQEAARLQALRWTQSMGMIVNSENTKRLPVPRRDRTGG